MSYCCDMMKEQLEKRCASGDHFWWQCPDIIITRGHESTGILIKDGGTSYVEIDYCPWCGSKLEKKT